MFETDYTQVQADNIARALDLVDGDVEEVFIYMSHERSRSSFNAFFRRGSVVGQAHRLGLPDGGPSRDEQRAFARAGLDTVAALVEVCERYGQDVPTEVRVTYSVHDGRFASAARYAQILNEDLGVREVLGQWMDDVRASLIAPAAT